jgi:hypothetical protein
MNQLSLWRLLSLLLALALVWAIYRGDSTERWVEAQAQNRARELQEIEAEAHQRPGEDFYAFSFRRNRERAAREQLCKRAP